MSITPPISPANMQEDLRAVREIRHGDTGLRTTAKGCTALHRGRTAYHKGRIAYHRGLTAHHRGCTTRHRAPSSMGPITSTKVHRTGPDGDCNLNHSKADLSQADLSQTPLRMLLMLTVRSNLLIRKHSLCC